MTVKIVIGLDGTDTGERALTFAKDLASKMDACELLAIYVIEWSPFTFQTAEENAQRHNRREEEIDLANKRIVAPAVEALTAAGLAPSNAPPHESCHGVLLPAYLASAKGWITCKTVDTAQASPSMRPYHWPPPTSHRWL